MTRTRFSTPRPSITVSTTEIRYDAEKTKEITKYSKAARSHRRRRRRRRRQRRHQRLWFDQLCWAFSYVFDGRRRQRGNSCPPPPPPLPPGESGGGGGTASRQVAVVRLPAFSVRPTAYHNGPRPCPTIIVAGIPYGCPTFSERSPACGTAKTPVWWPAPGPRPPTRKAS